VLWEKGVETIDEASGQTDRGEMTEKREDLQGENRGKKLGRKHRAGRITIQEYHLLSIYGVGKERDEDTEGRQSLWALQTGHDWVLKGITSSGMGKVREITGVVMVGGRDKAVC